MNWIDPVLDRLVAVNRWAYLPGGESAIEPAALTALALIAHGRRDHAAPALEWLATVQQSDGRLGVTARENTPGWPTSLAVLAWHFAGAENSNPFAERIERGIAWILQVEGAVLARTPEMGHDSTLVGWPWVETTHSWIEPTAMHVLALKATGRGDHPRVREAVRLLQDRLLPGGGCNYGNTTVLGQLLLPHLEPTGLALVALSGETAPDARTANSIAYLRRELSADTPTQSLCYGLVGLAAHGALPSDAQSWLSAASTRTLAAGASTFKLALLALAALGKAGPLVPRGNVAVPVHVGSLSLPVMTPQNLAT